MSGLRWREKCITMPKTVWSSPSKRRIPRLVVEERAREVALEVFFKEAHFWFKETRTPVKELENLSNKTPLKPYKKRYLLPEIVERDYLLDFLKERSIYIFRLSDGKFYYSTSLTEKPLQREGKAGWGYL